MKSKALDLFVPARLFAQFCAGRHKGVLALCLASCMLGLSGNARAQSITTFDAPDAGTAAFQGTFPYEVLANGTITGYYIDSSNVAHGYLRTRGGAFTTIDAPGAGTSAGQGTFAYSVIPVGAIAGSYIDGNNEYHGFLRDHKGNFTTFFVPQACACAGHGTFAGNINPMGTIAGQYADTNIVYHGFVRSPDGTITTFDAPGAGTLAFYGTFLDVTSGLNQAGAVPGDFLDGNGVYHGFVRAAGGSITTFDAPGADTTAGNFNGTFSSSINPAGAVAGDYLDVNSVAHGFLRAPNGSFTTFDAPGAGTIAFAGQGTVPSNLNPASAITGNTVDSNGVAHGFLRATDGVITTFDAPGAGTTPFSFPVQGTIPVYNDPAGGSRDGTLTRPVRLTASCGPSKPPRDSAYAAQPVLQREGRSRHNSRPNCNRAKGGGRNRLQYVSKKRLETKEKKNMLAALSRRPPILRGVSASLIPADPAINQAQINATFSSFGLPPAGLVLRSRLL
jgi:hypothetical protein